MPEPIPQWSKTATPIKNPLDDLKTEIKKLQDFFVNSTQKSADGIINVGKKIEIIEKKIDELEQKTLEKMVGLEKKIEDFSLQQQKISNENADLSEKFSAHRHYIDNLLFAFSVAFVVMSAVAMWQKSKLIQHENVHIVGEKVPTMNQKIDDEVVELRKKINDLTWERDDLRKKLSEARQKK